MKPAWIDNLGDRFSIMQIWYRKKCSLFLCLLLWQSMSIFVLPICILLLHVKHFKGLSEQMNSCHFKFHSKYCKQSAYLQTLLSVFALCKSMKNKWTKNDKNRVVQGALYQIICLSLLNIKQNHIMQTKQKHKWFKL